MYSDTAPTKLTISSGSGNKSRIASNVLSLTLRFWVISIANSMTTRSSPASHDSSGTFGLTRAWGGLYFQSLQERPRCCRQVCSRQFEPEDESHGRERALRKGHGGAAGRPGGRLRRPLGGQPHRVQPGV